MSARIPKQHGLGVNEGVPGRISRSSLTLRRIEIAVVAAGVVIGILYAVSGVINPYHQTVAWLVANVPVVILVGWSFLFVGLVATNRRPGNVTGLLISLFGVTWFSAGLAWIPTPLVQALADLLRFSYLAVLANVFMVFPQGRPRGRLELAAIIAVYVWFVLSTVTLTLTSDWRLGCRDCSANPLYVTGTAGVHVAAVTTSAAITTLFAVLLGAIVIRHWVQASAPARRALAPAIWSLLPLFLVVLAFQLTNITLIPASLQEVIGPFEEAVFVVLPVGLLVGILRTRLGRAAVTDLVVELSRAPVRGTLRDSLARALGDPSLELALALPNGAYVDGQGRAVFLPAVGSGRAITTIVSEGNPLAVLVHDPAVEEEDPGLVAAAGSAARLALENERLQAEVRASLDEVRASRARIQEAADAERRRLERDIHDGAQQRLVALTVALRLARDRAAVHGYGGLVSDLEDAAGQLNKALSELRELAHGIHPAVLSRAGIGPALRTLSELSPVPVDIADAPTERYTEAAEAAVYFVVSEALTNAAKHSGATHIVVSVRRDGVTLYVDVRDDGSGGANPIQGTGLVGMSDRVAVLGGRIEVSSPPGAGTLVHAEIPCG